MVKDDIGSGKGLSGFILGIMTLGEVVAIIGRLSISYISIVERQCNGKIVPFGVSQIKWIGMKIRHTNIVGVVYVRIHSISLEVIINIVGRNVYLVVVNMEYGMSLVLA
jgi:hypothetical protein